MFPLVCISLGFSQNRKATVGAIYAPLLGSFDETNSSLGTLWSACKGRGAYQSYPLINKEESTTLKYLETHAFGKVGSNLNPNPISNGSSSKSGARPLRLPLGPLRPLPKNSPNGLLLASEWGKDRKTSKDSNLRRKADTFFNLAADKNSRIDVDENKSGCLKSNSNEGSNGNEIGDESLETLFGGQVHGIRSLGSAALDLAYTASGSVDIFWEGGCWEWVSKEEKTTFHSNSIHSLLNLASLSLFRMYAQE